MNVVVGVIMLPLLVVVTMTLSGIQYSFAWNFVVTADVSCTSNAKASMNNVVRRSPERLLLAGDLSYTDSPDCLVDILEDRNLKSKTRIAIGNHDDENPGDRQEWLAEFPRRNSYYAFNYLNAHFLVLDTDLNYRKDSSQYQFAKNDLEVNADDFQWVFVMFHKPMRSCECRHQPLGDLATIYEPLFNKHNVDVVFQGHNHNYQRSDFMNGIMYIVSGLGGRSIYQVDGDEVPAYTARWYDGAFGVLNVRIDGDRLTGTFYKNNNDIRDSFSFRDLN